MYPHATKQFYEMFENDDSQYDGVYAMLASKLYCFSFADVGVTYFPYVPRAFPSPSPSLLEPRVNVDRALIWAVVTVVPTFSDFASLFPLPRPQLCRFNDPCRCPQSIRPEPYNVRICAVYIPETDTASQPYRLFCCLP